MWSGTLIALSTRPSTFNNRPTPPPYPIQHIFSLLLFSAVNDPTLLLYWVSLILFLSTNTLGLKYWYTISYTAYGVCNNLVCCTKHTLSNTVRHVYYYHHLPINLNIYLLDIIYSMLRLFYDSLCRLLWDLSPNQSFNHVLMCKFIYCLHSVLFSHRKLNIPQRVSPHIFDTPPSRHVSGIVHSDASDLHTYYIWRRAMWNPSLGTVLWSLCPIGRNTPHDFSSHWGLDPINIYLASFSVGHVT